MLIPSSSWHIRPLKQDDIEDILTIERASFPTAWTAKGYEYELAENQLAHYVVLSHETAGIVGYAGYWILADEIHLSIIAVDPAWRGRNLGELLLLHVLQSAYRHEATLVTLEVRQSNIVAQALYRKYGFEEVGTRPRYYHDNGEDACIMTVEPLDAAYATHLDNAHEAVWAKLNSTP